MIDANQRLACPKCQGGMLPRRYPQSQVLAWRCEGCGGLWLPEMAHEDLREEAAEVDAAPDAPRDHAPLDVVVPCPACVHWPLIRMVDPQQPHIRFESCTRCYGRYYDAGEYRDFADEEGLLERLFGDRES